MGISRRPGVASAGGATSSGPNASTMTTAGASATLRDRCMVMVRPQTRPIALRGRQLVPRELVSKILLRELAHARLRDFVDEDDVVRQPPLGDLRCKPLDELFLCEL